MKSMRKGLEIGCECRHSVTEQVGILIGKSETLHGTTQFGFRARGINEKGMPFESVWYDDHVLERISKGILGKVDIVKETKTDIVMGMTVEHFSGFKGVVIEKVRYFSGCVHMGIIPRAKDEDTMPEIKFIPSQYLKIVKEEAIIETDVDSNGGPSSSAPLS